MSPQPFRLGKIRGSKVMGQSLRSVLIVTKELLLRDAIADALNSSGKIQTTERDRISSATRDLIPNPDIVIYVEARRGALDINKSAADIKALEKSHWIILGDSVGGDLVSILRKSRSKISFAPLSIRKDALLHLVMLAAEGHEVRLDNLHDNIQSTEGGIILGAQLTPSQLKILNYLVEGLSNKEIAIKENSTLNSIKVRVRTVLSRLEVENRTQAAVLVARARFHSETSISSPYNSSLDGALPKETPNMCVNPRTCEIIN